MKIRANLAFAALCGALSLCLASAAYAAEAPYGGTAAAVPGTVQAENYDTGGQAVAYNVTSTNGSDNGYRSDGVDLEVTTDTGGGVNMGWTTSGQWFKYTVNVATAGKYTVTFRVASPAAVADAFHISNSSGTNLSGSVAVPATGGYQTWTSVTASVTLPAGTQTLTVNQDAAGWNLNWMSFAAVASGEAPYGGTAAAIPGTVMASNYDTGGQGVAYNVTSTNGTANSYRTDGVDLEAATSPATGNDLGWTAAGQWFRYTVNVSTAGAYTVSMLVASPAAVGDAFHISNSSGTNLSGSVAVPATGGYQTWVTVTASVTLPAGTQTLTVNQDAAGWNIDSLKFASSGSGGCTTTPSAPTGLSASGTSSTGTTLNWTTDTAPANCSISSYTVLKNGASIGTATGTSFAVTGLTASTNYSFTVEATDAAGISAASSALSVTTSSAACAAAPSAPTGFAASGTTSTGTTLNWTADTAPANCSISSYTVLKNGASIGTATGTSFAVTGLTASTAYSFTVEATDAAGTSAASSAVSVTTSAASGGGGACAAAWVSTTAYTAGMEANVSGINYVANFWTQGNNPATSNGPSGSGQPWTSLGACSACTTVPSTPTGLADSGTTSSSTNLSWSASTVASNCSLSGYTVYRNGSSVGTSGSTSFTASGLSASTSYTFTVSANDSAGGSGQSSSVSVTTPACTGSCGSSGSQVFAPYMDISLGVGETVASMASQAGLKSITLAFLVDGGCVANWGGLGGSVANATFPNGTTVASAISALQAEGVSIIISWGGAEGSIQSSCSTASQVQAMYQSVFNAYPGIAGQDFDIEGGINNAVVAQALAGLKSANPSKLLSLTLPVEPSGLLSPQLAILTACKSAGFNPDVINGMAMDYGSSYDNGAQMGLDATDVASSMNSQIQSAGLSSGVGVTPMIGVNDTNTEIFQLADATTLVNFAKSNSYVKRLAMWSLARDNGGCAGVGYASATCSSISQSNFGFSSIFNAF